MASEVKMDEARKSNYLQIGPSKLCTKFYEVGIDISETGNLSSIIPPNEIGTPLKIQFHIMGMSLTTKEFYGFKGITDKAKFKVQINSEIQFLAAYFKQFPSLTFYLTCGEKLVASGSMDLLELTDLREHFTASAKEKIILKSTDGKNLHVNDYLNPFLKVEISLIPVLSKTESDFVVTESAQNITFLAANAITPIESAVIFPNIEDKIDSNVIENNQNLEEPIISCGLIPELQLPNEPEDDVTLRGIYPISDGLGKSQVIISSQFGAESKKDDENHEEKTIQVENRNVCIENSQTAEGRQSIQNPVHQNNPRPIGFPTSAATETLPKVYVEELATKYIEELEDWKEKQQEMFKFELKRKADKHLSKLSLEWSKRQQSLEEDLTERLENCQSLKNRLEEVLLELELKIENLNKFEQELQFGKNELDKKYTMKFRELRRASKQHQNDMQEKIRRSDLEKNDLKNKIKDYEAEIATLNSLLKSDSDKRLTVEESKKISAEKEVLEQKLQKAVESKNYFKQQCYLAVREMHRIKEEKEDNSKWQIRKDKENIQIIGLVEEINSEVDEMRKDQSTLKALRNEILKYGNT